MNGFQDSCRSSVAVTKPDESNQNSRFLELPTSDLSKTENVAHILMHFRETVIRLRFYTLSNR
jgi:hypothetical protein